MVAVRHSDADRFIAKPPSHVFAFLLFGTDAGLISERKANLLRQLVEDSKDAFQVIHLHGDQIAADPLRLLDEANAISMFGGRRAITVAVGSKSILDPVQSILANPPQQCTLVLEAGALKRDTPLRKLLEREKSAATIECYPDKPSDIDHLIDDMTRAAGLKIAADAKKALIDLLGADRLTTRSEIDKLLVYAHGKNSISLNDVELMVADASLVAMDAAINGAFLGNHHIVDEIANRLLATGGNANILMAMVLRHAINLHRARQDGTGQSSTSRQGGYGFQSNQEEQLKTWTLNALTQAISNIADTIAKVRLEPNLADIYATRCLWSIARMAKR